MNKSAGIRQLYHPVQPTIEQSADCVSYSELLPDSRLREFIYCYWQLNTTHTLSEQFNYRVVADGCIDIFFELSNPKDSYVMGFCEKFTVFPLANSFNYVGIRFLPAMLPQLFDINAKELTNRFEALADVIPAMFKFIYHDLHAEQSQKQIKEAFDAYFLKVVSKAALDIDNRLYDAIQIILKKSGMVEIESDLNTGISPRQLRRLFEFYIGDTAKTFSKVVRFQNILKAKPSSQMLRKNKLFFDLGYYDQAHFIKEFKNFYGSTPGQAFER